MEVLDKFQASFPAQNHHNFQNTGSTFLLCNYEPQQVVKLFTLHFPIFHQILTYLLRDLLLPKLILLKNMLQNQSHVVNYPLYFP